MPWLSILGEDVSATAHPIAQLCLGNHTVSLLQIGIDNSNVSEEGEADDGQLEWSTLPSCTSGSRRPFACRIVLFLEEDIAIGDHAVQHDLARGGAQDRHEHFISLARRHLFPPVINAKYDEQPAAKRVKLARYLSDDEESDTEFQVKLPPGWTVEELARDDVATDSEDVEVEVPALGEDHDEDPSANQQQEPPRELGTEREPQPDVTANVNAHIDDGPQHAATTTTSSTSTTNPQHRLTFNNLTHLVLPGTASYSSTLLFMSFDWSTSAPAQLAGFRFPTRFNSPQFKQQNNEHERPGPASTLPPWLPFPT
ncbi:hypothetical protein B0T20DRAFT_395151 [Sordaria brevicollis]|uniref:Uncharacterized protein n=1 Tax=Sordaria brevicollis TaxID=83679 RepID=A0AAE0PB03_SORBR|nr:hypothetical protein B0T20DRAFT_395151 [Sordaria brevicollis]